MLYYLGRTLFRLAFWLLGGLTSVGAENIPPTGGVILAPNHRSFADPPVVGCGMNRKVHYMAKEELFKVPILGKLIRAVGSFPVRRGMADRAALKKAIKMLEEGRVVCIFPEGTRSVDGRLKDPELGIGLIALKSRAPVVPVAVLGTDKVLGPHSKLPRRHPIKVVYGKPITFDDLYEGSHGREALEEVGRRTMDAIASLLAEAGDPKATKRKQS
ncbi:MAG: lysophospholipid acyltransferase family protein [Armatimonadota bacterium]|nr:lysophospholipid acyltransferase family protein [Armatimonadota bacterium]